MFDQIQDPRIAQAFSSLAGALVPDAGALIDADLDRRRGGLIDAQTRTQGATANAQQALAGLRNTQASEIQQGIDGLAEFATALTGQDFTTAEGRAALSAAAARAGVAPDALTGYSTYADPNFVPDDDDFSRILLGTGAVASQAQTPSGFNATNELALQEALLGQQTRLQETEMEAAAALERAMLADETARREDDMRFGPDATSPEDREPPPSQSMSLLDQERLLGMFAQRAASLFPDGAAPEEGALRGALPRLMEELDRNGGNAMAAIETVLSGLPTNEVRVPGTGFLGIGRDRANVPDVTGLADVLVPGSGGGGAPAPQAPPASISPGQRAELPDGSIVQWNGQAWVPAQ